MGPVMRFVFGAEHAATTVGRAAGRRSPAAGLTGDGCGPVMAQRLPSRPWRSRGPDRSRAAAARARARRAPPAPERGPAAAGSGGPVAGAAGRGHGRAGGGGRGQRGEPWRRAQPALRALRRRRAHRRSRPAAAPAADLPSRVRPGRPHPDRDGRPGARLARVAACARACSGWRCGRPAWCSPSAACSCAALRAAHRRGRLTEPAVVVGAGTFGAYIAELMREHPELGLRPMGLLDDGPPRRDLPVPSLGSPADLADVVRRLGIRRVIVCFSSACRDEDLVTVMRASRPLRADVCVVPRLYELGMAVPRGCLDEIWGIPLIPLRQLRPLARRARAEAGLRRGRRCRICSPWRRRCCSPWRSRSGCAPVRRPLFRQVRVTGHGRGRADHEAAHADRPR